MFSSLTLFCFWFFSSRVQLVAQFKEEKVDYSNETISSDGKSDQATARRLLISSSTSDEELNSSNNNEDTESTGKKTIPLLQLLNINSMAINTNCVTLILGKTQFLIGLFLTFLYF